MTSKLGKSAVRTGDDSDMFDFYGHLTSSEVSAYDGFFTETIDASEKFYGPPKVETPKNGLLLIGTERDDTLYGSELNDEGLAGDDRIDGGGGNDLLFGGAGSDRFLGGAGIDTVSYANNGGPVHVNLFVGTAVSFDAEVDEHAGDDHTHVFGTDTFYGIERIIGSDYDDLYFAAENGGYFDGGGGDDVIFGGVEGPGGVSRVSVLLGGDGDDTLLGGSAPAWMTGGSGADEFNFGWGTATVTDFESGFDKIWATAESYPDDLPFGHDGILASGTEVPTVRNADGDGLFYDTDDYSLYDIRYNADGEATATLLATFINGVQIQTSDFIL